MWPHTLASDSTSNTSTKRSQVRQSVNLQHALWWGVHEEIASDTVGNLFHTKTALRFARLCVELVQRTALLVKGARARRALQRVDACARSNAVWKHVGCLHKNAGLRSSCMFQLRDTRDVAAAKECAARMSVVPRVRRLQFISSQPKKMI